MKGEIDINGNLIIRRGSKKMVRQFCPKKESIPCGDHYPKFGEPYQSHITNNSGKQIDGFTLSLCERDQLFFTEFIDRRK